MSLSSARGCPGDVQVNITANNPADIIDFSGKYTFSSDSWVSFSYENEDPPPSLGVESLYMSSLSGGCGSWFMTENSPSYFWDVGSVYYALYPLADSEDTDDCLVSAPEANELRGGNWVFVCQGCTDYEEATAVTVAMECLPDDTDEDSADTNPSGVSDDSDEGFDVEDLPLWAIVVVIVFVVACCGCMARWIQKCWK